MCGIAGIVYRDRTRPVERELLQAMVDVMRYRGPDDTGYLLADGVGLAMTRLSIIDCASGRQPIATEDGAISVVQNGEIYNYVELRQELLEKGHRFRTQSDTEVLAHGLEEYGGAFPAMLNGMFAIAAYDRRDRSVMLIRDRLGKKPLYLFQNQQLTAFASEIKCFFAAGLLQPELDRDALDDYLSFNYVPPPLTIYRGIWHMEAGTSLTLRPEATAQGTFWQLQERPSVPETDLVPRFEELLGDAVRIRLRADMPVGVFLSGGVDSAVVAWAASRHAADRVKTFSIGFPGFDVDETEAAAETAQHLGTDHRSQQSDSYMLSDWPRCLWHNDQPHGDTSFLPFMDLCRFASRSMKVALSGEGGDELFCGYDWYLRAIQSATAADHRGRFEANAVFTSDDKACLWLTKPQKPHSYEHVAHALAQVPFLDPINQMQFVDLRLLLVGNNLVKPDRMGLANSLELRAPMLDYRLVEFAFAVAGESKVRGGRTKSIVKDFLAGKLPAATLQRRKQMFAIPFQHWVRANDYALVREVLLSAPARDRGLFDPARVQALVDEHRSGDRDHTRRLRALMAFEIWCRCCLDQTWSRPPELEEIGIHATLFQPAGQS